MPTEEKDVKRYIGEPSYVEEIRVIVLKAPKDFEYELIKCHRCGWEMKHKKGDPLPDRCGECKSKKWNVPRGV